MLAVSKHECHPDVFMLASVMKAGAVLSQAVDVPLQATTTLYSGELLRGQGVGAEAK